MVKLVDLVLSLFHSSFVPLTTHRLGRLFYIRASTARSIIALTKPFSMTPHCLGTDDCTSINHTSIYNLVSIHAIPYDYTDQTPAYLVFLLSAVTWFGFLVPLLHYFNNSLSCLLHPKSPSSVNCFPLLIVAFFQTTCCISMATQSLFFLPVSTALYTTLS